MQAELGGDEVGFSISSNTVTVMQLGCANALEFTGQELLLAFGHTLAGARESNDHSALSDSRFSMMYASSG